MFAEVIAGNWLSQAAAWWLPILLDAALKGTVVLGVAGMMVLFMRRGSAAARHLVWTLGLVSLMLLPVLSAALPAWQVLPSWLSWSPPAARADAAGISRSSTSSPAQPGSDFPTDRRESLAGGRPSAAPAIAGAAARGPAPVAEAEAEPPAETALAQDSASVSSNAAFPYVAAAAVGIWLAGAAWALLPAAIACLSLRRLGRRSPRIHGGPWRALVDRLSAELGLRRRVAILCSPNRRMPMVWGTVRPKLLIPADASAWSPGRLRAVLLHELAHVRRHDCLVHWVAQLARAIHWFNPLAWIASRRAAMESERACDDAVLTHGFAAPDYAQHLLEIANGYRVRQWEASAAIAMARSSRLETRFLAILDGGRKRGGVTLRRALLAVAIGIGATALMAIIQPGRDADVQAFAGDRGQASKPTADAKTPPAKTAKKPAPPASAETAWVEFRGQVVDDETGRPVEQFGMQWGWPPDRPDPGNPSRMIWGGGMSSSRHSEGRFSARSGAQAGRKTGLRILADGYLPQPVTPDLVVYPSTNINLTVRMRRGGEVRGRVLDHAGSPVAGATVYLAGSQMLNLMDGKAEHFSGSTAMTDAQGRFSLSGVGGAEGRLVVASAPLAVWTAPVPEAGKEATVKLPEPALLKVRSEISGAGGQVRLHLELKTWEMEGWKGFVGARKYLDAPNPGDATFAGLTPGTYDFWRVKELSVGDFGKGMFLDRRTITLEPGKTTLAEFVRKGGHPIVGQLTGLKDTGVLGAFIAVKDGRATGEPGKTDEWMLPVFDADICAVDGQFKTETVPPGQYTVAAEAYKPEDRSGPEYTGRRGPDYVGAAKVTVGEGGPPPQVRIEMKPRAGSEKGAPKGGAKKDTARELRLPRQQATVEFRGQVVDDETGRPVEQFGMQWGWPDPSNPSRIGWGGISTGSSRRSEGRFSERSGWQAGQKIGLRILADGYLPQPVTPELVDSPSTNFNLIVRMKRGGDVRGHVLDHAGSPVAGATVYLAGTQMLNLKDGKPEHFSGSTAMTDEQGRFSLSGAGGAEGRLVIGSAPLAVWTAAVPEAGKEAAIKLPEPAALKVRSDISGAGGQIRLQLQLKTWEMEGWKGFVEARKYLNAPNPGDAALAGLTPGTYDLWRVKELSVGDRGQSASCDRRTITLDSGKTTLAEFVRKRGHPIVGQLTGLKDTGVAGAFIFVKDGKATGDPRNADEWKLPVFDADVCAVDGQFKTETVPPGQYTVVAEAYKPDNSGRLGERLPNYLGTAKVTVGEGGPPPRVRIEMKPYRSADAGKVSHEATLQLGKRAQPTGRSLDAAIPVAGSGDPKGGVKKDAEPAKTAKRPEPRAPAEMATVEFRGRVVDAETGFPIEQFTLQWGWPDPTDPKRIAWGGSSLSSSRFRNGEFSTNSAWEKGRRGGLRVLADGYLPQPVVPDVLVEAPATWVNLVVRLKRGGEIAGRVLDHTGKPVPDAVVYLAGNMMLNLVDGTTDEKSGRFSGSTAVTDAQGRFALSGVGGEKTRLVVTSAPLAVWTAPVPEAGKEATITLPQPAGIKIRFDVPGGGDEGRFHLHLKTWEMEGWKQFVDARRYLNVPNAGEKSLANLTAGKYDLARTKQLRVGNRGQGVYLDRRDVILEAGKTTEVQLVRKGGHPITGQLTGLKDTGVAGAFIFVKDGKATGDPRKTDEWKLPTFDADVCAVDGQFKTEMMAPGEYMVIAEAYEPQDRSGGFRSGERSANYVGTAKVTVGEGSPPPQVRIEMKPYRFTP